MGNISSHTASFLGGGALFSAVLGILGVQFHIDPGLATDWLIVVGAVLGGPVLAYLSVKAKDDPALAAALAAINAMTANGQGPGHAVSVEPAGNHEAAVTVAPAAPVPASPAPAAAVLPA